MIERTQIIAGLEAQIVPLKLEIGASETAVVLNKSGKLQTITFTRTK